MQNNIKLFDTPFSKEYWKQAASELKNTKTLIFAALMIALRIALQSVSIYIAADLRISIEFLVNALGAMTFGPVVAIAGAAVSDTLGALLFPSGPYFFLFIFTEIAGSMVFALFFYRTRISVTKVILSRFCTNFFVNIVLQTPIMYLYYQMMLGKTYKIFNLPRMIKNLVLFPVESLLLVLFLRALIPPLKSLGYKVSDISKLHFTKKNIVTLVILTIIGVAAVVIYVLTK